MEYRRLGNTDLNISVISLGCFSFGGDRPTGSHLGGTFTKLHAECWGEQDEADSFAAVKEALDAGINCFDNAEMYGDGYAEDVLGRALESFRDEYPRSSYIIATKLSETFLAPELIEARLRASLNRLKTDYIDLYQLHWASRAGVKSDVYPDRPLEAEIPLAATLNKLKELQEQGLIRHIAVCNFGPQDIQAAADSGVQIVSNQVCYNLIWRGIEREVVPMCADGVCFKPEEGKSTIGILAWSPLQQGILSGKFESPDDVPPGRQRTRLFSNKREFQRHGEPGHEELLFKILGEIKAIATSIQLPTANGGSRGVHMVELALAWCMAQRGVSSVLMGARNATQVKRNIPAIATSAWLRSTPEGKEVLSKLDTITAPLKEGLGSNLDPYEPAATTRIY